MAKIDPDISMNEARKDPKSATNKFQGAKGSNGDSDRIREIQREIQTAKTECFGGKLFRRKDEHGCSIVSFAVHKMSEREKDQLQRHYGEMISALPAHIAHRGSSSTQDVGEYTVFNFMIDSETLSLREWIEKKGGSSLAESLMQKLTNIIIEAYNYYQSGGVSYRALSCLTPDTVFVSAANKRVTLLPLVPVHGKWAACLAPEVCLGLGGDETSDLYAAAYLSAYAATDGNPKRGEAPLSDMLLNCMQAIPAYRPDLKTVRAELQDESAGADSKKVVDKPEGEEDFRRKRQSRMSWLQKLREIWQRFCASVMSCVPEERETTTQTAGTMKRASCQPVRKVQPIETIAEDQKE